MWGYVRGVAVRIGSPDDVAWRRRGLAIAAVEGGRIDYRDTIVSLVILRYGAERAGIDPRPFFDEAMATASPQGRLCLRNARDHSRRDVLYTVREMGPPEWRAEARRS
jgi:hypothetical protein